MTEKQFVNIELSDLTLIKLARIDVNENAKTFDECINNLLEATGVK